MIGDKGEQQQDKVEAANYVSDPNFDTYILSQSQATYLSLNSI